MESVSPNDTLYKMVKQCVRILRNPESELLDTMFVTTLMQYNLG